MVEEARYAPKFVVVERVGNRGSRRGPSGSFPSPLQLNVPSLFVLLWLGVAEGVQTVKDGRGMQQGDCEGSRVAGVVSDKVA